MIISVNFCCNNSVNVQSNSDNQKRNERKKMEWERLNKVASQFGAIAGFDTLNYLLTYEYQNYLVKNNKIVLNNLRIDDIKKSDSGFIVSFSRRFYFYEINCNSNQAQELAEAYEKNRIGRHSGRIEDIIFVISISSINKVKFEIEKEIEKSDNNDEEPSVNLDLGASLNFIVKGNLISIQKIH